jgi:hypothetical protein
VATETAGGCTAKSRMFGDDSRGRSDDRDDHDVEPVSRMSPNLGRVPENSRGNERHRIVLRSSVRQPVAATSAAPSTVIRFALTGFESLPPSQSSHSQSTTYVFEDDAPTAFERPRCSEGRVQLVKFLCQQLASVRMDDASAEGLPETNSRQVRHPHGVVVNASIWGRMKG